MSNYKKSEANARSPGTSQRAIAVSIFALMSPEALGLRPIAFIAPIPIRPIPSPDPITPSRASPSIYVKDRKIKVKIIVLNFLARRLATIRGEEEDIVFPEEQATDFSWEICESSIQVISGVLFLGLTPWCRAMRGSWRWMLGGMQQAVRRTRMGEQGYGMLQYGTLESVLRCIR